MWKRLLPQVMNKGRLYRDWNTTLYVVVQDSVYSFLARRMHLIHLTRQQRDRAEIVWVRWDYDGTRSSVTGRLDTSFSEPLYSTVESVEQAFLTILAAQRPAFVAAVVKKKKRDRAKLASLQRRMEAEAAQAQALFDDEESSPPEASSNP